MNRGVTTAGRSLSRRRHRDRGETAARRRELRPVAVVAISAVLALYGTSLRPRMLTWGATSEEVTQVYPGDELYRRRRWGDDGDDLPSAPDEVWRWLVQMGGGRAGWYSWDWLDNDGTPSADRIVPAWQHVAVSQHLPPVGIGSSRWTVVIVEPNRTLVLQTGYEMLTGRGL